MELWDVYDKEGNKTGKTHTRGVPLSPGDYHLVVENWIRNDKGHYLIQKRNKPLRDYVNPWSSTAGSVVAGESSIIAVQRETEEEMGLFFSPSQFSFKGRHRFDDTLMDVYESLWNGDSEALNFDPEEVSAVKWVKIDELQKMVQTGEFYSHRTPYLERLLKNDQ
ncbi:MAG: NUDIX domain-containing protein [Spirochaetales bacterium]|nr:NUDIX domain-containing protein [Spirochaetales bacterium]